jgi:formate hydrogenlyase transcriptional activator
MQNEFTAGNSLSSHTILYLDDNLPNLSLFKETFREQYDIDIESVPSRALNQIIKKEYKIILVDYLMPGMNGLEFIQKAVEFKPDSIYMIITAFPDLEVTLSALDQGNLFKFIVKPWKIQELSNALDSAFETYELRRENRLLIEELSEKNDLLQKLKVQLEEENQYLQEEIKIQADFENIISKNKAFKQILKHIEQVAETSATVLILGETGTGKELVARAVHSISDRSDKTFVKLNCATIPENLIESDLFGHVKGAFTGAIANKKGRFELASGGTIFLDEIGELPLSLQPKLLRVLQEGEFERIGDSTSMRVDVRVIAATNRNLLAEMKKGNFRSDLFYRLNVFPINIPPLRDRRDDIPALVAHFIENNNRNLGKSISIVPQKSMDQLIRYDWPGNIRELENVIERAMIICKGKKLELNIDTPGSPIDETGEPGKTLEEVEKNYIISVLKSTNWRVSGERGAAKILGMIPTTLESRLIKLGIKKS